MTLREPTVAVLVAIAALVYALALRVDLLADRVEQVATELRATRAELVDVAGLDCLPVLLPPPELSRRGNEL